MKLFFTFGREAEVAKATSALCTDGANAPSCLNTV